MPIAAWRGPAPQRSNFEVVVLGVCVGLSVVRYQAGGSLFVSRNLLTNSFEIKHTPTQRGPHSSNWVSHRISATDEPANFSVRQAILAGIYRSERGISASAHLFEVLMPLRRCAKCTENDRLVFFCRRRVTWVTRQGLALCLRGMFLARSRRGTRMG